MKEEIIRLVQNAFSDVGIHEIPLVERPGDISHGDYATNAALVFAKHVKKSPKEFAESLVSSMRTANSPYVKDISIAGPGFINFILSDGGVEEALRISLTTLREGGKRDERINIEFISANPTGDLHIGHGRNAFFGDVL